MSDIAELEAAHTLYEEGRKHLDAGDLDAAAEALAESARISPHFKTLELLGECNIRRGRYTEAVIHLAAASTLNGQVRAPSLLAEVLLHLGERLQARRIARSVLARNATNRKALNVARATEDLAEDHD